MISFVLGFALASLVAWLGNIPDEVPVTPIEQRVAPAVIPMVTAATEEKTFATMAQAAPLPHPAVSTYRGALVLSSSPEGSEVELNGEVVGATPVVLSDLPAGSHVLVMRRDGYSPWSASVHVTANQRTAVKATLVPAPTTGG